MNHNGNVAQPVLHDLALRYHGSTSKALPGSPRVSQGPWRFSQEMCLLYAEGDPATGAELGRFLWLTHQKSRFCWRKHLKGKLWKLRIFEHFCPSNPGSGFNFS